MTLAVRFWQKVAQTGNACECWDWTAAKNNKGYGVFRIFGALRLAHRISYELTIDSIPAGLELDHLCRNRLCVNPWHLEAVSHAENTKRGTAGHARGQQLSNRTHCPQGHEYTPENTHLGKNGSGTVSRGCITCRRARSAAWNKKVSEAKQ